MKIIDNFLSEHDLKYIISNSLDEKYFPFYLSKSVSMDHANDGIFFTHIVLEHDKIYGNLDALAPLLTKIKHERIFRVKYNLYPKTFFMKKHNWHRDYPDEHKGLIYYLNTNNGRTDIRGQARVKSIKNRALFFDPSKQHRSTTCTDQKFRANVIINYI
tara:strand:+ start:59 stop:535 length:477 start_codon:yes stop_codon:yes gene_type:complete